jgi:elongation factor Ts
MPIQRATRLKLRQREFDQMEVSAATVKELREKTGAGMMDCKKALAESAGDVQKAIDYLRQKGLAAAAKKADRMAADGAVGAYVHPGGKIGVLVEINCETDFVARTAEFQALLKDIAMQVAAANPRVVRREEVAAAELEKEKAIYRQQALDTGKPEKVVDKIVEGKLERFYSEVCLMEQSFIKDPDKNITNVINDAIARLGENIQIRRFARYHLGEGSAKE